MRQAGEITQVKNGMMQVTFCRPEACAGCNACGGQKREHTLWVRGAGRVGDIAVVDMPDRMVVKASFAAYGLPLITMLLGLILGSLMGHGRDLFTAVGTLVGLAAGFALLAVTERKRLSRDEWTPKVVEILEKGGAETE